MSLIDKNTLTEEIVLCDDCKGKGVIECSECCDYHKGEYDYWFEKCEVCGGKGRLTKTTKVTYKLYKQRRP